jgi:hypothetical protein
MPRDGALILSDVRSPSLSIVCELYRRRGRYNVAKLMGEHGDGAKLTDLMATPKERVPPASMIAARPRTRGFEVGHYEGRRRWAVAIYRRTRPIA